MNQKLILILGAVVLVAFAGYYVVWSMGAQEGEKLGPLDPWIPDIPLVPDREYVAVSMDVQTQYGLVGNQMYADIDWYTPEWVDIKGWDTQWFTTADDIVVYVDLKYNGTTYSYSENIGKVSTVRTEYHSVDITSDITDEIYQGGNIYYTVRVREGTDILKQVHNSNKEAKWSGAFTMPEV